ncbi:5305_t:CDS:2, partial [Entrophospora sp. SA101]
KRWRRLRWSNYIGKQKAMDKICRRIANNERTVVAFGHASFSSSSKGHAAGPIKQPMWELRKRCREFPQMPRIVRTYYVKMEIMFRQLELPKRNSETPCIIMNAFKAFEPNSLMFGGISNMFVLKTLQTYPVGEFNLNTSTFNPINIQNS